MAAVTKFHQSGQPKKYKNSYNNKDIETILNQIEKKNEYTYQKNNIILGGHTNVRSLLRPICNSQMTAFIVKMSFGYVFFPNQTNTCTCNVQANTLQVLLIPYISAQSDWVCVCMAEV